MPKSRFFQLQSRRTISRFWGIELAHTFARNEVV